jgi:hypothetical protein
VVRNVELGSGLQDEEIRADGEMASSVFRDSKTVSATSHPCEVVTLRDPRTPVFQGFRFIRLAKGES